MAYKERIVPKEEFYNQLKDRLQQDLKELGFDQDTIKWLLDNVSKHIEKIINEVRRQKGIISTTGESLVYQNLLEGFDSVYRTILLALHQTLRDPQTGKPNAEMYGEYSFKKNLLEKCKLDRYIQT